MRFIYISNNITDHNLIRQGTNGKSLKEIGRPSSVAPALSLLTVTITKALSTRILFLSEKGNIFLYFSKKFGSTLPFSDRLHPSTRIRFLFENENFYLCTRIGPELFYNSLSVSLISMFGRQSCLPKHFYVLVKLRTSRSCKWNSAGSFNASTFQPCVAF